MLTKIKNNLLNQKALAIMFGIAALSASASAQTSMPSTDDITAYITAGTSVAAGAAGLYIAVKGIFFVARKLKG